MPGTGEQDMRSSVPSGRNGSLRTRNGAKKTFVAYLEPQGQPFVNGWLSIGWWTKSLYRKWLEITKHPFINGCLGFQVVNGDYSFFSKKITSQIMFEKQGVLLESEGSEWFVFGGRRNKETTWVFQKGCAISNFLSKLQTSDTSPKS